MAKKHIVQPSIRLDAFPFRNGYNGGAGVMAILPARVHIVTLTRPIVRPNPITDRPRHHKPVLRATHISFVLRRSLLIQLFVVVLAAALTVFPVLILSLKDIEALAAAVASYF